MTTSLRCSANTLHITASNLGNIKSKVCARSLTSFARRNLRVERCICSAEGTDGDKLDAAAYRFATGVSQGLDADELVAAELGATGKLTEMQEKYKDKLKEKLAERAEELRKHEASRRKTFTLGKLAYERGNYSKSVELLESALNEEGPFSLLGGEIQLWLALAYQADGREEDSLDLYRRVEASHPVRKIRKQAAELRFILEAPRLELTPEERIEIPVLTNLDLNRKAKPLPSMLGARKVQRKYKMSLEEQFLENYQPPAWLTNRYVWVASAALGVGLAWYSTYWKEL